ncbi:adenine phosphoribosyltransferase [Nocardioides montaniterrae]
MDLAGESASGVLQRLVRDVPDFPSEGVLFKDIMPLLADPAGFAAVVDALAAAGRSGDDVVVDKVVGMESRGFLLGAPVALALGVGFVPARKPGKLPGELLSVDYALEYGTATLEIQADALAPGERVLVVDDVLATGGTAQATCELVERAGASVVGLAFLMDLSFLPGRAAVAGRRVTSLLTI